MNLDALPDAEAVRARAEAVLAEDLYWFGVRHHSPTVAAYLAEAIEARRPRVVFLEAPAEAGEVLEHVTASDTRPPVAIYSSYRDDDNVLGLAGVASEAIDVPPKFPSWYPLTACSPEYVALSVCRRLGIEVVCMDLPHYALAGRGPQHIVPKSSDDELFTATDFYASLARAGGFRTWDEAWDTLFERRSLSVEAYRRQLALFCAAARSTASDLGADTRPRERHMWQTIRLGLAARGLAPSEAMVVCGGFHLFLDRDDHEPPPPVPPGTVHVTVVPYSWFRLSSHSGYGAGNRAPRFYQRCFDDRRRGIPVLETLASHAIDVLAAARRLGERLAAADTIAVVHHAHLLAQLRRRPEPVLDDLHDALITCCVKGDPSTDGAPLRRAMAEVDVGSRVGRVTRAVGRLPLLADFYDELDRLELRDVLDREAWRTLTLDTREPRDHERAAFLHRVRYLGVPLGDVQRSGDPFGHTLFRERWRLRWTPAIDDALVERSLDGDTVRTAALARLGAALARTSHDAAACCAELVSAVDMDLSTLVVHAEEAAGEAIDRDDRFVSLARATGSLLVLERYAAYRGIDRTRLVGLVQRAWQRASLALPQTVALPEEDHDALFSGLKLLAELVMQREDLDGLSFVVHCTSAAELCTLPHLRGAYLGVLVEMRAMPPTLLADELRLLAAGPRDTQLQLGAFLDGVLAVSKLAVLLGARDLVAALDAILEAIEPETFLAVAPRLRGAFARLHLRQRTALAEQVASRHGTDAEAVVAGLHLSAAAAALVAELDAQTARVLDAWRFS